MPSPAATTYPPLPPRRSTADQNAWSHERLTLGELHEQDRTGRPVRYVAPAFQRALCWDARRRCDYLQAMFLGEPQSPLALWRPNGADYTLVLDGQHRLVALGCTVVGADGQHRELDAVRFNLHTLEWEPGQADEVNTLGPERLLKPHHHLWLNRQAAAQHGEAWWDHVCALIARLYSHNHTPVLMSYAPESPAAWANAVSFFTRMARSVPFTEAELEAVTAYAAGMARAPARGETLPLRP